jgi:hypothetical protein
MHSDAVEALRQVKLTDPNVDLYFVAAIRTCATQLMCIIEEKSQIRN